MSEEVTESRGLNRRQMITRLGAGAAGVWAAPAIISVAQAHAESVTGCGTPGGPCASSGGWSYVGFGATGSTTVPIAITINPGESLQVTDFQCVGDQFEVFIDGVSRGNTNGPCPADGCAHTQYNADLAYADGLFSHGCFSVSPGNHTLVFKLTASPYGGGTVAFRDSTAGAAYASAFAADPQG